jgi:hypothetical protein
MTLCIVARIDRYVTLNHSEHRYLIFFLFFFEKTFNKYDVLLHQKVRGMEACLLQYISTHPKPDDTGKKIKYWLLKT